MGLFPQSNSDCAWAVMHEHSCISWQPIGGSVLHQPSQYKEERGLSLVLTSVNLPYLKYHNFESDVIENLQNKVKWSSG